MSQGPLADLGLTLGLCDTKPGSYPKWMLKACSQNLSVTLVGKGGEN